MPEMFAFADKASIISLRFFCEAPGNLGLCILPPSSNLEPGRRGRVMWYCGAAVAGEEGSRPWLVHGSLYEKFILILGWKEGFVSPEMPGKINPLATFWQPFFG